MTQAGALDWTVFAVIVAGLIVLDIVNASCRGRRETLRSAWLWTLIWIGVSIGFGGWIFVRAGTEAGIAYFTAYVLEKSLSLDNLAVFAVVFAQTGIAPSLQHRALFWGVLGALVMRAALIAGGIYLLERFHWLVYPFGALLAYAALRMVTDSQPHRPWVEATCRLCSSWVSRFIPIVPTSHGERFLVKVDGKRHATPLFVALVAIESADLVFAMDSIPAVLAVTRDPFLVYASNIFALLGLRSLYGVVGDLFTRFRHLRLGLAALLVFAACKLVLSDIVHLSPVVSLGVIAAIVIVSLAASRLIPDSARNGR